MIIFNKNLVGRETSFTRHQPSERSISRERISTPSNKGIKKSKKHKKYKKLSPLNKIYLKSLGFTLKN